MRNNSFGTLTALQLDGEQMQLYSLPELERLGYSKVAKLPYSLKILLENLLRSEDGQSVRSEDIQTLANWDPKKTMRKEIAFKPARVLLQDFTGVPAVVDLAAMRDGVARLGGDPNLVNPLLPVELVIDHSVQVDHFGYADALQLNADLEFSRNGERYVFLRWGQNAFKNFRVVPPNTGIVHQVNLEHLARGVCREQINGTTLVYPDTLIGTDSHTTMVNGLGVVGWGVGGIEAEAVMLGQPISMLIPEVIGFRLVGRLPAGTTATDLVLTITERLRQHGVVGKFVEFFGPGLENLTVADRATLGNMCPEYGATIAIFPIDNMTLDYLRLTGRTADQVRLVETYAKAQGLFRDENTDAEYAETISLDLSTIEPSLAGPRRPQDRISLKQMKPVFKETLSQILAARKQRSSGAGSTNSIKQKKPVRTMADQGDMVSTKTQSIEGLDHGSVVVAAITSCTNTSNPSVMIGAGLLAKRAVERGLTVKPWVKTSLAPGSLVVTEYLKAAGLFGYLEQLGFNLVGYGCTTCIGNSGPLPEAVSVAIDEHDLVVAAVLSGNRNFEGRIQPQVRANYLASPPLVIAYALAGRVTIDLASEPIGHDADGLSVYLKDIWPADGEIQNLVTSAVRTEMFHDKYAAVFEGEDRWRNLPAPESDRFAWNRDSTYIQNPPFFDDLKLTADPLIDVKEARVLAVLGDSVTTDHISPAGSIPADSPAGQYLVAHGVQSRDFNSYGSRRGNHEVMMRGTFANIRLRNQLVVGTEGGWTRFQPSGELMTIYDAAMLYKKGGTPLVVLAGKEYGSGSSRDWAAKGTFLLGIRVVIAESFERIHRSNLVNMGVLPLQFKAEESASSLQLTGNEVFGLTGIADGLEPRGEVVVLARDTNGVAKEFLADVRIDTPEELVAFRHGGILPYVLRQLISKS